MQLTLTGPRGSGGIRDDLERQYTPNRLAEVIVDALPISEPNYVIEASVGGGAFVRAVRRRWGMLPVIWVCDADPSAPGLELDLVDRAEVCDALTLLRRVRHLQARSLIIGNPPFSLALEHLEVMLATPAAVCQILPLDRADTGAWLPLWAHRPPLWKRTITPRPWPANCRGTAAHFWPGGDHLHAGLSDCRPLPSWRRG